MLNEAQIHNFPHSTEFAVLYHSVVNLSYALYHILLQELFSKQKGFLEEELDYRKQALDQAYMVWSLEQYDLSLYAKVGLSNRQNPLIYIITLTKVGDKAKWFMMK